MDCLWKFISAFALARISHTLAAHLANHLAASGFVLPHHITLDMPWSSSPPGDQSITQSEPPECEISGLFRRFFGFVLVFFFFFLDFAAKGLRNERSHETIK